MRIDPKTVHPLLWEAFDDYERRLYSGGAATMPEAVSKHQSAWWKAYGKQLSVGIAGYVCLLIGAVAVTRAESNPLPMALALGLMVAHGTWAYLKNRRTATVDELEALLPTLNLSTNGRLYVESVVAVYRADLSEEMRKATLQELTGLMSDDRRLQELRTRLTQGIALCESQEAVREVEILEAKVANVTDSVAKTHYEESLVLARGRMQATERLRPILERTDAQQELIRQTLLRLRSDLGMSGAAGLWATPDALPTLRDSLGEIHRHAGEIERAVQELRQA